ncbi:unnamed protein product [Arctia plantaginis]|uniref:Protein amnionless n=1 Tax=Arctia plantaginis TaxID=874455 RepID=A0A8S1A8R2_ARCPL|nr:unnamed protein product [Arctia plantaginis]
MTSIILLQCITAYVIVSITASTVKWLPNSSFMLAENYKDGKLPCSKQTVVFPELVIGAIKVASETEVSGLILPEEGELILDDLIMLGADPSDKNCTDGNAYYVDKSSAAWNQADVWSSPRFNDATPDSDRIPCFNDVVQFPQDAKITVTLPKETQHVKALYIGNESYSTEDFRIRVLDESNQRQQFVLNDFSDTGLAINTPMSCTAFGCPCQIVPMTIDCSVKYCQMPNCLDAIKPLGFCCEICGGSILFDANKGFDMLAFHQFVEKYTTENHIYYIGFAPEAPIRRIQLVIVDKGGYVGTSTEVINSIHYDMEGHWYKGERVLQISGTPLSKTSLAGKIFISMFFAVILTFFGFYVYYYKMGDLRYPLFSRSATLNIMSRFQRRSDSVVSLTRRDSVISTATGATAFRNPMYDSKRGRVQVVETMTDD